MRFRVTGSRPYTPSTSSPSSAAAKLSPGVPFLRDPTIARRKTIITPSTSPLRQPTTTPLTLDIPPPVPLKDYQARATPSPITDHPDYADFVYRPLQAGRDETAGFAWGAAVVTGAQGSQTGYEPQVSSLGLLVLSYASWTAELTMRDADQTRRRAYGVYAFCEFSAGT